MKPIATALIAAILLGCDREPEFHQSGRFCESGASSQWVGKVHLTVVRGNPLGERGQITGPVEKLLYLAILLPQRPRGGPRGASEAGPRTSTWTYTFELRSGQAVETRAEWDRVEDAVKVDGQRFDRGAGNVILIEIDDKGRQVPRQNSKARTGLVPDGEEARVIKEEFPHLAAALSAFP